MTRIRYVGGTYIKKIGGDYNMYAEEINFRAAGKIIQKGEEGEIYTNQPKLPPSLDAYFEEGWWSLDPEGEKKIRRAVPGMQVYFHITTKNIPDGGAVYMGLYDDDINEPEEKNSDDHIPLKRVKTAEQIFYGRVQNGKIVQPIVLKYLDPFLRKEIDGCVELYFRCSFRNKNVELPRSPREYLVVGALVIDRYKMPGLNEEGTDIAEDMSYGQGARMPGNNVFPLPTVKKYKKEYEETGFDLQKHGLFANTARLSEFVHPAFYDRELIVGLGKLMQLNAADSDAVLFANFRALKDILVWGDLSAVLDQMINKFENNEGGIYENKKLTDSIKINPSTRRYCTQVENYMAQKIKEYFINGQEIEDKEPDFFEKDRISKQKFTGGKNSKGDEAVFRNPLYPYTRDNNLLEGRTLALNDIWATEVILKTMQFSGENYTATYQVTLWDHFGLDLSDMDIGKGFYNLAGFRSWFILQHLRGYKPFITKITFKKEFKGNIKEGLQERLNQKT